MSEFRPWGLLNWVLPRCPVRDNWALLGCLSTEDRALAAWRVLRDYGQLNEVKLIRISNKSSRYDSEIQQRESKMIQEFKLEGGNERVIESHYLLEPSSEIVGIITSFLLRAGPNIILDVSTFPKRFFFPLLKLLLREVTSVPNLVVTYTSPAEYTAEKLAENCDQWDHLPLFSGSYTTKMPQMLVVNVGFEAFGLQEQIDHGEAGLPLKLLFPFPAPPQAVRRSWELARRLLKHRSEGSYQIYHTDAKDVGDAFDRLVSLTDRGSRQAVLAPFGPKPISVAMCIFATLTESQVFYTQPTVYHPDYSYGVGQVMSLPSVWAYCLRLEGHDYYQL